MVNCQTCYVRWWRSNPWDLLTIIVRIRLCPNSEFSLSTYVYSVTLCLMEPGNKLAGSGDDLVQLFPNSA